jgi:3-hydroxybutyryl-CoA dehydrogenase
MVFTLPADVDQRPVVIDGAGTLGRRIASVYAAGGSDVRIFDLSAQQREAARDYVEEHVAETQQTLGLHPARHGRVEVSDDLQEAVAGGWMVIEAVPERTDIKTEVFGELDRLAEPDAILCSNSSSIPTSHMIGRVEHPKRVLNTHYQQPPELNAVELMSCGKTDEGGHRRSHGEALPLRAGALLGAPRERRVHLQPHLGCDQARVPDGR